MGWNLKDRTRGVRAGGRAGMSLVEVLIAFFIFSLLIPSIYASLLVANRLTIFSAESFAARSMCQEKIEMFVNMGAEEIKAAMSEVKANEFEWVEQNVKIMNRGLNYDAGIKGTRTTRAYYSKRGNTANAFSADYFDILTDLTWNSPARHGGPATLQLFTRIYP